MFVLPRRAWVLLFLGAALVLLLALPAVLLPAAWRPGGWALLAGVAALGFLALNVLAWRHARAMTHYASAGQRTPKPQNLSLREKLRVLFSGVVLPRPELPETPGDHGLPWEVHTLHGPETLEAWYVPHPRPRGLVAMFHGYADCKATLLPEAAAFHALGWSCLLVDFPGCGGSTGCVTTIGAREADDVLRTLAFARGRWPGVPLVVYGQSMGSAAVLRAAAGAGIRADAFVLECPFDRMLNTVKARFRAMGVPAFPSAHLLLFWGGVQLRFNGFRHNPVEYARSVTCPTLLLHGAADAWITPAQIEALYANLRGPRRLQLFPGVGHESLVERCPGEWKAAVDGFLSLYVAAPASGEVPLGGAWSAAG
jgi:alpha-beta hydrolase superfamily lysophospholipase